MDPFITSKDTVWRRWMDGAVLLFIGVFAGLMIAQGLAFYEVTTVTTTRVRQPSPAKLAPDSNGTVQAPITTFPIDEI